MVAEHSVSCSVGSSRDDEARNKQSFVKEHGRAVDSVLAVLLAVFRETGFKYSGAQSVE